MAVTDRDRATIDRWIRAARQRGVRLTASVLGLQSAAGLVPRHGLADAETHELGAVVEIPGYDVAVDSINFALAEPEIDLDGAWHT